MLLGMRRKVLRPSILVLKARGLVKMTLPRRAQPWFVPHDLDEKDPTLRICPPVKFREKGVSASPGLVPEPLERWPWPAVSPRGQSKF